MDARCWVGLFCTWCYACEGEEREREGEMRNENKGRREMKVDKTRNSFNLSTIVGTGQVYVEVCWPHLSMFLEP